MFLPTEDLLGVTIDDVSHSEAILQIHSYPKVSAQESKRCGSSSVPTVRPRYYQHVSVRIITDPSDNLNANETASKWSTALTRCGLGLKLKDTDDTGYSLRFPETTPFPIFESQEISLLRWRRVKVVISPVSGPGKSPSLWKNMWEPMFKQANIATVVQCTFLLGCVKTCFNFLRNALFSFIFCRY